MKNRSNEESSMDKSSRNKGNRAQMFLLAAVLCLWGTGMRAVYAAQDS